MKLFVTYDPATGEILGRMSISNDKQLVHYPVRLEVGKEITFEEFDSSPELDKKVDIAAKRLVPK